MGSPWKEGQCPLFVVATFETGLSVGPTNASPLPSQDAGCSPARREARAVVWIVTRTRKSERDVRLGHASYSTCGGPVTCKLEPRPSRPRRSVSSATRSSEGGVNLSHNSALALAGAARTTGVRTLRPRPSRPSCTAGRATRCSDCLGTATRRARATRATRRPSAAARAASRTPRESRRG